MLLAVYPCLKPSSFFAYVWPAAIFCIATDMLGLGSGATGFSGEGRHPTGSDQAPHPEARGSPAFAGTSESSPRYAILKRGPHWRLFASRLQNGFGSCDPQCTIAVHFGRQYHRAWPSSFDTWPGLGSRLPSGNNAFLGFCLLQKYEKQILPAS